MNKLDAFPISKKWPAQHPDRIQLYSLNTPNGVKASIMLEETGLPYEPHLVRFDANDQTSPEFLSLNPNNKIPAIIDPHGPGDEPLPLFESGAILIYLADKSGAFLPQGGTRPLSHDPVAHVSNGRSRADVRASGIFQQVCRQGLRGQAPTRPLRRRVEAIARVIDRQLAEEAWIMGKDYSIADIATFPWINNLIGFYAAGELVGISQFTHVQRVLKTFLARPAVIRGLEIPKR